MHYINTFEETIRIEFQEMLRSTINGSEKLHIV